MTDNPDTTMSQHPTDLLADYVDETLSATDLTAVRAHLQGCAVCTEEVELAASARTALAAMPDLEAPHGLTLRVLREARPRRARAGRIAWVGGGVAAAAAAGIIGFMALTGSLSQDEGGRGAAAQMAAEDSNATVAPSAEAAAGDGGGAAPGATLRAAPSYPQLVESDTDHTPASLDRRAGMIAEELVAATENGFATTAREFYRTFELSSLDGKAGDALGCATTGVTVEDVMVPLLIETASFDGRPAYVVAFAQGPDADSAYDRVIVWAVNRGDCQVRHYARQLL